MAVTLAMAEKLGVELGPELRRMTNAPRSGDLLPEHLKAAVATNGKGH